MPGTRATFAILIAAGLGIRLLALPLEGTGDVFVWKTWSHGTVNEGVLRMYGVGGDPPVRHVVRWGDAHTTVDYPPVALWELAAVGHVYRWLAPDYRDSRLLTALIKLLILAADIAITVIVFVWMRRWYGESAARFAALAYWLNPAAVLNGAVLGYLDPLTAAPAVGALVAGAAGYAATAGVLFAAAVLTKAQAVFLLPVVALAIYRARGGRLRGVATGAATFVTAAAVIVMPFVAVGAWRNMVQAVGRLATHDMLSGNAANLWWIVTYLLRVAYAIEDLGVWGAWTMVVRILGISQVVRLGYPNPRPWALLAVGLAAGWALWRARKADDLPRLAACGAFVVHAYFMLAVQVHENHYFLAVPLMALAGAVLERLRPVYALACLVFALNLFLFYGAGGALPAPPRRVTIVDSTVLLAAVNLAVFVWHARRFRRSAVEPHPPT